jgi:hypothetical protein
MFFNVIPSDGNYPVYNKDSILNTNPKFDYGPFLNLAQMINVQKVNVSTFSYVFNDVGTYVFSNALSQAVTIIGVVS